MLNINPKKHLNGINHQKKQKEVFAKLVVLVFFLKDMGVKVYLYQQVYSEIQVSSKQNRIST